MLIATRTEDGGYIVEGTDIKGNEVEVPFTSAECATFNRLTEYLEQIEDNALYAELIANLEPDPREAAYRKAFGRRDKPKDPVLHVVIREAVEAQNGVELDFESDPVARTLRLITQGQGNRFRLVAGQLIDMGSTPSQPAVPGAGYHGGYPGGSGGSRTNPMTPHVHDEGIRIGG